MSGQETLFTKIITREIPAEIVYEDEYCIAFRDINPQAPLHVLLVPKQVIAKLSESTSSEKDILGHLMVIAPKIAAQEGFADTFRMVINNGAEAGQSVFHLHLHILAGREFKWPPG